LPQIEQAITSPPESDDAAGWEIFLAGEARRYIAGGPPPLHANADNSRRVRLPTYPWQRLRFWPDEDRQVTALPQAKVRSKDQIEQWFYQSEWKLRPLTGG